MEETNHLVAGQVMFIQNVSYADVKNGTHLDPGENSFLIQICDQNIEFPVPAFQFKEIRKYNFMDVEETDQQFTQYQITQTQADSIAADLQYAYENQMNVIVHCIAGVCRSGAVAEVGVCLGFDDTYAYRQPNCLVKKLLFNSLGWGYDDN